MDLSGNYVHGIVGKAAAMLLVSLAFLLAGQECSAETLTLQQGASGYAGCVTKTLWEPTSTKAQTEAPPTALCMRGAGNRLLLKFALPADLRVEELARARLEVFLPEAKNIRMICETLCREVTQPWTDDADWENAAAGRKWNTPGGTFDTETDYDRGRPAGAADSYSVWEYDGRWFPHKYRFLDVPEGGKWIDFNITPLVRKWLKDPQGNHGVALQPIDQQDKRFPNQLTADIPSALSPDVAHRPRLTLEFEPLEKPYLVGMTDTLRKYCDRSTRYRFFGPFQEHYEMGMAGNEFEGFQILVYPMRERLEGVTFHWGDLVDVDTGAKIPASDVQYNRQEVVLLHRNGKINDWYFHGKNFHMPDPLIWAKPADPDYAVVCPYAEKAGRSRGGGYTPPRAATFSFPEPPSPNPDAFARLCFPGAFCACNGTACRLTWPVRLKTRGFVLEGLTDAQAA